jgi:deazaflavin-dependent oxidoreductase (nitroreductase family)
VANMLTKTLLRTGIKLVGFGTPTYLLTVRGRKSGQPRTTPISVLEQDGKHYLMTPYGVVDWVRNLRAAGEATLTRGRRTEQIRPQELPTSEAILVLKRFIESGHPIGRFFGVSAGAPPEAFERLATSHPVFFLPDMLAASAKSARQAQSAR